MKKTNLMLSILVSSVLFLTSCGGIQNSESLIESDSASDTSIGMTESATETPASSSDDAPSIGESANLSYKIVDSKVTITGAVDSSVKDLTVPESIEGYEVSEIELGAFEECDNLESIVIPFIGQKKEGLSYTNFAHIFGAPSFHSYGYKYIPDSLTSVSVTGGSTVAENAFSGCTNLTSITIPNGVKRIEHSAFASCSSLTSFTIPESVTDIETAAFDSCIGLNSINIPDSVVSIGEDAFLSCVSLTSVSISDSVTSIGDYSFSNCIKLDSITLSNSVTAIGDGAFNNCTSLVSVTLSNSLKSIGKYAFFGCPIVTVVIPESVTSIGDEAFENSESMEKVYYMGNTASWEAIDIGSDNHQLNSLTLYYYSESQPTESGNYWHYVDSNIVEW